jgi:general secretion pathway protein G
MKNLSRTRNTGPALAKTGSKPAKKGFTLAEMMVVIVIIGILATIVVPNVWQKFAAGQQAKIKVDIMAIMTALDDYAMQNNAKFPDTLEPLVQPDMNGHRYLNQSKIPKDPWGEEYGYEAPSPGNPRPRVFTYGRDKSMGGEGDDADVDNITIMEGGEKK